MREEIIEGGGKVWLKEALVKARGGKKNVDLFMRGGQPKESVSEERKEEERGRRL